MSQVRCLLWGIPLLLGACASVPVSEQGVVSAENMTQSESVLFSSELGGAYAQVEPGSSQPGGAAGGCTTCR